MHHKTLLKKLFYFYCSVER